MTRPTGPPVAVLDANVLYPQWLRDVLLTLAALGYFEPAWSEQIIDEMRRNVLRDQPDIPPARFDAVTIAALRRAFPDAWVEVDDDLVTDMNNAPGDRHVLAAAVAGSAHVVVTDNTTDFESPRYVASGRIAVMTPAAFLSQALDEHQDVLAAALEHLAVNRRGVSSVRDVLDRLERNRTLPAFVDLARTRLL